MIYCSMSFRLLLVIMICVFFCLPVMGEEERPLAWLFGDSDIEMHGFYEMRAGYRLQNDKYEKDMSIMEGRL